MAGGHPLLRTQFGVQFCGQLVDLVGVPEDRPPFLRQLDRMADPLKKMGIQFPLQLLNLEGYCGLGEPQPLRCPGEAGEFCRIEKGLEVFQIHRRSRLFHLIF